MATPAPFPLPVPLPPAPDGADPLLVLAGLAGVLLLFAARELAAGALRQAGEDLWGWLNRRRRADPAP